MNTNESKITDELKKELLNLAQVSIEHGLKFGSVLSISLSDLSEPLREEGASFVTLFKRKKSGQKELRGCIGMLQAMRPLGVDVVDNAYSAAFRDMRFSPLKEHELKDLLIKISVLSPSSPLLFDSEEDLLNKIRPQIDGLVLIDGFNRGTFLPSVWEQLPNPVDFLNHLKMKAGLPMDYWSDNIKIERYTTDEFGGEDE